MLKRFVLGFFRICRADHSGRIRIGAAGGARRAARSRLQPGCDRNLANASASVAAMQARLKGLGASNRARNMYRHAALFSRTRQGARSRRTVQKRSRSERELGRFDADVEHINEAIAARCS